MKFARRQDAWRRVNKDRKLGLKSLRVERVPNFHDSGEDFPRGLLVLSGLNGAGKTTLARAMSEAIRKGTTPGLRPHVGGAGSLAVTLQGDAIEVVELEGPDADDLEVAHVDVALDCWKVIELEEDPNFADLLEAVGSRTWDDGQVSLAAWALGRTYQDIRVFEIEDTNLDDEYLPFFEVASHGVEYSSFDMGLGELALLTLLWRLWRVQSRTVVFLEEPETYLSSTTSAAVMDVLAELIEERGLYGVVTTHSSTVIENVPLDSLRLVERRDGRIMVSKVGSRFEIQRHLGLRNVRTSVILVEDVVAKLVLEEMLGALGSEIPLLCSILSVQDGVTDVTTIVSRFPQADRVVVVGVVDGDQTISAAPRLAKLPGHVSPEELLSEWIVDRTVEFASAIGREESRLNRAIGEAEGYDPHDFFGALAENLGGSRESFIRSAVRVWMEDDANRKIAKSLDEEIAAMLEVERTNM